MYHASTDGQSRDVDPAIGPVPVPMPTRPTSIAGATYAGPVDGLLELDGLHRRFGSVHALDGLTFSVPAGEVTGFLGPNGAGKTTAMRAVFGLADLDAGAVRWDGAPVDAAARRRFGYMPEERGLYPAMRVGEQLEYLGRLHGMTAPAARAATGEWLERLGVADRASSTVESLSHGNQQRVQLAGALAAIDAQDPEAFRQLRRHLGAPADGPGGPESRWSYGAY